MKKLFSIVALAFVFSVAAQAQVVTQHFTGAWWMTNVPSGYNKQAGEIELNMHDDGSFSFYLYWDGEDVTGDIVGTYVTKKIGRSYYTVFTLSDNDGWSYSLKWKQGTTLITGWFQTQPLVGTRRAKGSIQMTPGNLPDATPGKANPAPQLK